MVPAAMPLTFTDCQNSTVINNDNYHYINTEYLNTTTKKVQGVETYHFDGSFQIKFSEEE